MLSLVDHWVWDSWYLYDGNQWHCWFLKAPQSIGDPDLRHWNVSQGHAVSHNLFDWEHRGTALSPSSKGWDDCTVWTGSTLKGPDNQWHYFYTGTSHNENGTVQRIGHATGDDLEHWHRVGDGQCLDLTGLNASEYETHHADRWHDRAMRDPWVMKDPNSDDWLMYFTARVADREEVNDAGCIGLAISKDLYSWKLQPPVFTGGWGQLEVPQVFTHNGNWYCLFCHVPEHQAQWNIEKNGVIGRGNHYLIADNPKGPWRLPDGPGLDSQVNRYAARIVEHNNGLHILGFKDEEDGVFGGYVMDPDPVYCLADGTLSLIK